MTHGINTVCDTRCELYFVDTGTCKITFVGGEKIGLSVESIRYLVDSLDPVRPTILVTNKLDMSQPFLKILREVTVPTSV